ncbi:arginine--tRNA ligase [Desulfitobacterium hafniense]|uniref:Arginine--tRNA ligase n=4 Tax=root TaxID=1 RepID=SYR_DESHY|nr:arginine--tRNA ligase [Desulfitobacterium hafniense]B8FZ89.1 RecName: Full=Arginine--tRNA ligase; AltName: Full=Arginyl-tRNA synthetase; Short=ArgRS [Desulfitobacterium hafniense DCB-2]Q24MK7.1 RecName: Full=Arginine--tRNA ligase; AltName: Full=Arginyl-tRNA synthetase; Short=ArgRS [Desulfitobacterium hafniense Y51]ACL22841.1 arginyl-tRNA synthetase [Desulfitobacterium hafniense DCB-2]KTE93527.1 arginine--tRNA ligase [Desulfitobacterium hafniense]MEA5025641.1 arginine--tRNA ligase [Desulfito
MSLYINIKDTIYANLAKAALEAQKAGELSFESLPNYVLEEPREKQHGDWATNLAMVLTKQARKAPRDIATILIKHLDTEGTFITASEIAGPGFINFRLDPNWLTGVIPEVLNLEADYGKVNLGQGKKVQVEFVSANPTGLLHMGNARGAALGDSLAALLAMAGYEVSREFYINDAGNQIYNFALSLEARYLQLMGQDVPFPEGGYHGEDLIDTVKGLIEKVGNKYLNVDQDLRREFLVRYALEEKLTSIRETLTDMGVHYDCWFSEQSLHDSGFVKDTMEKLEQQGYIYEKEGAQWLKSTLFGDEKDEVVVRGNGTPTYFAADIAYHRNKFERGFDRVINIWGADHHGHVARMKGAMSALGYDPENLQIILMQLVRLIQNGEVVRMSKRSGQYITLRELMDEVGKDAARFFFIMRDPDSTVEFDLDLAKAESSDNPVYYVQYAHARLCSILRQAAEQGYNTAGIPQEGELKRLQSNEERELLKKIAELPNEIEVAARLTEPHRLARYVLDLAGLFHSFYNSQRVLVDEEGLREARLGLVRSTKQVLANVLGILGVTAPERM